MKALYTASATSNDRGREGHARSSDGVLDVDIAVPKELGGPGGATNPEQLFAAGYAACFANAMRTTVMREDREGDVEGATVTAHVDLGALGKGRFGIGARLEVHVPRLDQEAAEQLVAAAHERCPYSNATRGNIDVRFDVRGGEGGPAA